MRVLLLLLGVMAATAVTSPIQLLQSLEARVNILRLYRLGIDDEKYD
jgi:hypothetical protein